MHHVVVHWSSGRLGNVGTHWFDALGMLLGAEAQAVSGTFDPVVHPDCRGSEYCDPGGWGIVAISGGIKAFIHGPQEAEFPLVLRVAGSLGQLTLRGNCASVELWSGDKRSIAAPSGGPNVIELAVQDIVKCYWKQWLFSLKQRWSELATLRGTA